MPVYNEVKTVESVIRKIFDQPEVAELIVDDAVQRRHLANPPRRSQPPEHL
jgi:hypothetical protein